MVKILSFEAENFKRIRAIRFEPTENGLTVIGGNNAEGKTSVLDAIAFALGGKKFAPAHPTRDGSVIPGRIELTLSNGLVVTRKGKNASLTVTDPEGKKAGQALLDSFVSTFALDLPKFMASSDKDKVSALLATMGIEEDLAAADFAVQSAYNERAFKRKLMDEAKAKAASLPSYDDAPDEEISMADLTAELTAANEQNQKRRDSIVKADSLKAEVERAKAEIAALQEQIEELEDRIADRKKDMVAYTRNAKAILDFLPEEVDTEPITKKIECVGELNARYHANQKAVEAAYEAKHKTAEFEAAEAALASARESREKLLDPEKMPVKGLTVEDGALCYNGHPWAEMSGAEQLVVAAAIVQKTAPDCGFILMDKMEQMDARTLDRFGKWAGEHGLQIIATRVSTGGECSIIIEDGEVVSEKDEEPNLEEF